MAEVGLFIKGGEMKMWNVILSDSCICAMIISFSNLEAVSFLRYLSTSTQLINVEKVHSSTTFNSSFNAMPV